MKEPEIIDAEFTEVTPPEEEQGLSNAHPLMLVILLLSAIGRWLGSH